MLILVLYRAQNVLTMSIENVVVVGNLHTKRDVLIFGVFIVFFTSDLV